jgi:hypothetical protein
LIEIEDAHSDLAHLREKAETMIEQLNAVGLKLRHNISLGPSSSDFTPEGDIQNRLGPEFVGLPGYGDFLKVIEELKTARQKVYNLELRKAQLQGAPTTFSV